MRKAILASILIFAAPAWASIALVHTTNGTGSSTLTISSTTAGHSVLLVIDATTQPSSVTVGSQSATKNANCSVPGGWTGSNVVCLWYVSSDTGGHTLVTMTGAISPSIWEYEYSGTNTGSLIDAYDSDDEKTDISMYILPSQANEAMVVGVSCITGNGAYTISGSPTALSNVAYIGPGEGGADVIVSSITAETVASSGCGDGSTSDGAVGAMWSIKASATAAARHPYTYLMGKLNKDIWRWYSRNRANAIARNYSTDRRDWCWE